MKSKSNIVFLCSKYRGDIEKNLKNARRYARMVAKCGYPVVAPHLLYPQFLDDNDATERIEGIKLGVECMKLCSQIWIFGTTISEGMEFEIEKAKSRMANRLEETYLCTPQSGNEISENVSISIANILIILTSIQFLF
jgi:hypothetical protein